MRPGDKFDLIHTHDTGETLLDSKDNKFFVVDMYKSSNAYGKFSGELALFEYLPDDECVYVTNMLYDPDSESFGRERQMHRMVRIYKKRMGLY